MTGWRYDPDADEAVQVDTYLESILAGPTTAGPIPVADGALPELDAGERAAADLLRVHLVRFHPSFRFEEGLAGRLRAAALGHGVGPGDVVAFPPGARTTPDAAPATGAGDDEVARRADHDRRRALLGGAIASGVSLAGAALFAWRITATPRSPLARATRAAHRERASLRGRA